LRSCADAAPDLARRALVAPLQNLSVVRHPLLTGLLLASSLVATRGAASATERRPFADRAVAWYEHDEEDVARAPRANSLQEMPATLLIRDSLAGEVERVLSLRRGRPARDVNALDEVPCSSWFCPRNHLAPLPPEEAAAPPPGAPAPRLPLRIVAGKDEGATTGFQVVDADGRKFMLKLDPLGHLGLTTGAEMIGERIFHAAGYNVPGAFLVDLSPDDLIVDPAATFKLFKVERRPLTAERVRLALENVARGPDGRVRGVLTPWIAGAIVGGFDAQGRRLDDPNDRIPHEDRRSLRASWALYAWLSVVDPGSINSIDAYVRLGDHRFVRHYIIDFGAALGSFTTRPKGVHEGAEHIVEVGRTLGELVSLGFYRRPFEEDRGDWQAQVADLPAAGWFPARDFDPDEYRPRTKVPAHMHRTARDLYWGAKVVTSFSDAQLDAIVATAGMPARDAAYISYALRARRDVIGRRYLRTVTAVEDPVVSTGGDEVCFEDLAIARGYAAWREVHYAVAVADGAGRPLLATERATKGERACVPLAAGDPGDGYRVVAITTKLAGAAEAPASALPARVHLRWRPAQRRFAVVGLERDEQAAAPEPAAQLSAAAATQPPASGAPAAPPDPRNGEELDGRVTTPAGTSAAQVALTPPRYAARALFWPVLKLSELLEVHRVIPWMEAVLTTDDKKTGVRPELQYATDFLPRGGLRFFTRAVPGTELTARVRSSGPPATLAELGLTTPPWLGLQLRGAWHRRRDLLFAGIGSATDEQLEASGLHKARYGADAYAGEVRWSRRFLGALSPSLHGDVVHRTYTADGTYGGPSIGQIFAGDPLVCAQLGFPGGCVDPTAVPGFERGLRVGHAGAGLALDIGRRGRDGSGFVLALDGEYGQGLTGDPTRLARVSAETMLAIGGLDRVLLLRLHAATVEPILGTDVPFEELIAPAGLAGMRGFPEGRFRDRSGWVATAEYRWFVAFNLDAALFVDAGSVAGPRFAGLGANRVFPTFGIGLRRYATLPAHYWLAPPGDGVQLAYAPDDGFRALVSLAAF
jgi:hypothetical protein